jgi:hypothetical protein
MNKFLLSKFLQQLFVLFALVAVSSVSYALDMSKDQAVGPIVLKINGKIGIKNTANGAVFDDALLDALPQKSFFTETPWTHGGCKKVRHHPGQANGWKDAGCSRQRAFVLDISIRTIPRTQNLDLFQPMYLATAVDFYRIILFDSNIRAKACCKSTNLRSKTGGTTD